MTTLSINELSPSERRRLGLPEALDRLPPERGKPDLQPRMTSGKPALLTACWMTWDNEQSVSK
jgi:hypothetical protein